ncbi:MAG: IS66 family transposase [Actinomycetota bacterium]|nr:IS66 family transposase [Actinomycetota bacterium]
MTDIPPARPWVTRYDLGWGRCQACGKTVRGRHDQQSSDAVGAAASQVGLRALALAAWLHHGCGLSHAKTCQALARLAGITLTPGGLVGALHRMADRLAPTDAALVATVRACPMVSPDETGWRVGGLRRWLWTFATASVVVYRILDGRGYDQAAGVLGPGYAGVLVRDGWAPYRKFELALHQTCLAHLARRCRELIADARAGQARVPHLVAAIIADALALRDRRDAGDLSPDQLAGGIGALTARVAALVAWRPTHAPNRRLLAHLAVEAQALFTFLRHPGVDATNWRAEQAIRPAVVNRKPWGGNASDRGARTTQTITGVLATARLQARDPIAVLTPVLRARAPTLADLDYTPAPLPATGPAP